MIILTLKERRLIEEAVFRFGNDRERSIWAEWAQLEGTFDRSAELHWRAPAH